MILVIIPLNDVSVCIGRVNPVDMPLASVSSLGRRINKVGSVHFNIALGSQLGDDQVTLVVVDEEPSAVLHWCFRHQVVAKRD